MLPDATLPDGLAELLKACRSCFTTRSFPIYCLLTVGMIAQVGPATVTGILVGSGLTGLVGHDRVHRFFAEHRWCTDQLGLRLAHLVVTGLLDPDAPIVLAVDDTMFRRSGRKVAEAHLGHDASAPGRPFTRGNRWVIAAIVVQMPFCSRPIALPVLLRLWRGAGTASTSDLAREMTGLILRAFPERRLHIVADAAYRSQVFSTLPERASFTCRITKAATLFAPTPPRTGRRGRPRSKGDRLGTPEQTAAGAVEHPTTVTRYGRTEAVHIALIHCLWYGTLGKRPGLLIAIRDAKGTVYLFTTDLTTTPERIVTRYAARWSIESAIENAKQHMGVGQARNRIRTAVERTVPFGMFTMTLIHLWYAAHGHHSADVAAHRARRPWYTTKTEPAFTDMLAALRRHIIKARFSSPTPAHSPAPQIDTDLLAWAHTAA